MNLRASVINHPPYWGHASCFSIFGYKDTDEHHEEYTPRPARNMPEDTTIPLPGA
jgi:hypothetical protein